MKKIKILQFGLIFGLLSLSITNQAQTIFALQSGSIQIHLFDATNPGIITKNITITGITPVSTIVGMDFRPATGQLYVLGYLNTVAGNFTQLYTVDTASGLATVVGSPISGLNLDDQVAFDFNPTVDRIRIENSNGLNYRMHPVTGAIVATDGNLQFAAADVNSGVSPNIGACAYTNSYIAATATQLFVYDDSLNILGLQNPPNNGTINTIGSSGITVNPAAPTSDMDIWFDKVSATNKAYFSANTGSSDNDVLYSINTTTGAVSLIGQIGTGIAISDIAILIDRTAPATSGSLAYAVSSNNNLLHFRTGTPDYIISAIPVSGITAGYTLSGIDVRPLTGELYAFAYNSSNGCAKIYTLNPTTAVASQIGSDSITNLGLSGQISFDFNPTVDRIRLSSSNNKNYRLNPITGQLAATDGDLKYAPTDVNAGADPFAGASAYTNSYAGATSTTLYVFDDSLNIFAVQNPPNNGTLNTIGNSGLTANLADPRSDLDILFDTVSSANMAYFSSNTGSSSFDKLYTINLTTGAASLVGSIGYGIAVNDISLFIDRTAPAEAGQLVHAVTSNNHLVSFYTQNPGYIRSQKAISGISAGYDIAGTDFRNVGGDLYLLAYNPSNQSAKLYTVDETTAVATPVNNDSISPIDLSGRISVDFNPTVDRLRVETSNNKNYRINPISGTLAATDGDLNFASGDVNFGQNPNIGAAAYTNARVGATTTTLYVFDDSLNVLCTQAPPNNGTLNTIGNAGITQSLADQSSDLDIYYNPGTATDEAFLVANPTPAGDNLYSLNLQTGVATLIRKIGYGINIKDIAISLAPSSVDVSDRTSSAEIATSLWPNPTTEFSILSFNSPGGDYQISVVDINGRIVRNTPYTGSEGIQHVLINTTDLIPGLHFVRISLNDGSSASTKMVK